MIKYVYWSSYKVVVSHVRFQRNFTFLERFWKNTQISNSWKFVQWEPSCSMRTDGLTDRHDKGKSRFPQFSERPLKTKVFLNNFLYNSYKFSNKSKIHEITQTSFNLFALFEQPLYWEHLNTGRMHNYIIFRIKLPHFTWRLAPGKEKK
jgi:hypothetical protein